MLQLDRPQIKPHRRGAGRRRPPQLESSAGLRRPLAHIFVVNPAKMRDRGLRGRERLYISTTASGRAASGQPACGGSVPLERWVPARRRRRVRARRAGCRDAVEVLRVGFNQSRLGRSYGCNRKAGCARAARCARPALRQPATQRAHRAEAAFVFASSERLRMEPEVAPTTRHGAAWRACLRTRELSFRATAT